MTRLNHARSIGGRYRPVRLLGRGGMSEVWLARDERLGRDVAVKVIEGGPEPSLDFQRETGILSGLRHPNIVNVYDAGEEDGRRYLVMERVEGTSLRDKLRAEGPLSPGEVAGLGAAITAALAYAHARGVLHNDVKPENILIDADGEPRLTDFGAATITGATLDADGAAQVMGTIAYVAPEVLQGASPTPASDLYALATTLYEALAGRLPYDGRSNAALAGQKVNLPAAQLSGVAPAVPIGLATAIQRGLSTEPGGRPAPDEFRALLEGATDAAVSAVPVAGAVAPGPLGRSTQALTGARPVTGGGGGRRRGLLVAGGLLGAGLVTAGTIALSSGGEPRDEGPEDAGGVAATVPPPTEEPTVAEPTPAPRAVGNGNEDDEKEQEDEDKDKDKRDENNGEDGANAGNGEGPNGAGGDNDEGRGGGGNDDKDDD